VESPAIVQPVETQEKQAAPSKGQNQMLDMLAYIDAAESVMALENIWKSLIPKISKLTGPEKVDIQKAHDKRATALRAKK
jgi:hypothetical protein